MNKKRNIKEFPISFFAPVLGFAGFALALQKLSTLFPNISPILSLIFLGITIILFMSIGIVYIVKWIRFPKEVSKEYNHPIKINFFPLIAKILLVLSVTFLSLDLSISKYLWIAGVVLNTLFCFAILGEWISKEHFRIHHISPAWFIPVVGNLIVPIAGVQHFSIEISWFFFSVGIVWMFILTTIVLYRLIFHDPLPKKLLPTLFILFAAPAIAFIAYMKLTGSFDAFAHILYYFALFLLFLIGSQWRLFRKIKFYLSWWAYTFPLAAMSLGTVQFYHASGIEFFRYGVLGVVLVLALFIGVLCMETFKSIANHEVCIEEE